MVECSSAHPSPKATVKVGGIVVAVTNEFTRFDLILESHLTYIHSNYWHFSVDDVNLCDDDLDYLKIILNPFSATVLIVGSEGLEASVHSWITYLSLESWPGLYSRPLSPLVHVLDVFGVGEGVAPDGHLRRRLLQRLGCGFQWGLRPGVVSVFLCFAPFDPSQFHLVRKWCQRYMKSSSLSPLPSACKHISQWLTISRKKSDLSGIVKDRPKIPATKLGCPLSSSNIQGEPLHKQQLYNNKNRRAVAKLNPQIKFQTSS